MPDTRPNILWLITDEQRCDSLGCYGSSWAHTPIIDGLAQDGAVFETAVTPAPVCLPARTSLLTGKYPCQTDVWHNHVDMRTPIPNLMERFRNTGYRTASFGKQHYVGTGSAFSTESGPWLSAHVGYFDYAEQYDETHYDVIKYPGSMYNWVFGGRFPASAEETAEAIAIKNAMQWLSTDRQDAPFVLRVSFNGPHTPVAPPEPFDHIISPAAVNLPNETESLPDSSPGWLSEELTRCERASVLSSEQIRKMRQYYYGEVAFLDSLFGHLLDWMKERGLLDNTIVVYLSDHGTHLGDYGLVQKQTFFEPVVNVPFIWWYPSHIRGGLRFQTPIELQRLLPTLLDLAGLEPLSNSYAPSLASCLCSGREPDAYPVFSEFSLNSFAPYIEHDGRLVMVRHGDWKLSACIDPQVHDIALYNLKDDPHERTNCANNPNCQTRITELLRLINEHIEGAEHSPRGDA